MKILLWTWFGTCCLSVIAKLILLSTAKYPRAMTFERWEDCIAIVCRVVLGVVLLLLLLHQST